MDIRKNIALARQGSPKTQCSIADADTSVLMSITNVELKLKYTLYFSSSQ